MQLEYWLCFRGGHGRIIEKTARSGGFFISVFSDNKDIYLLALIFLGSLSKELSYLDMLRTGLLASAAFYAIGGMGAEACTDLIIASLSIPLVMQGDTVHDIEDIGYCNLLRTLLRAVTAGGAGNEIERSKNLADTLDNAHFTLIKGLKILHEADIIVHLFDGAHAGKHHKNALKACGKAQRIARLAALVKLIDNPLCFRWEVGKAAALNGFHYYDGFIEFAADFVDLAALHLVILVIKLVELYLDDLDLRVSCQYLLKEFR